MKTIIQVAEKVRDSIAKELGDSFPSGLGGDCAVSSYTLHKKLNRLGFKSKFVQGHYRMMEHCWVEIDNLIIDITATQFGIKEKVYITRTNDKNYQPTRKRFLKKEFKLWPNYQKPNS